ncbi:hypothetical protein NQ314_020001 [Rhamnusium bicolor]|uniref:Ankyrin repeat domain-containing protein 12 n=1 Tax=Rhamnusium bicolor TaxID=1586634 RepID=A0AAV8WP51_9CUCU|nr:hypothetical protein NQ314_020001 [Rhamnusium bicolor]
MPSSVRPKGSSSGNRAPPVTPMSERQQMALLMQMTSSGNEVGSRSPSSSSSRTRDRNERGETPLHLAAIKGDVEQVCKLLAHRADPNVADFAGWTPLHEACNHGWYEVAFRLVQSGANVNAKGLHNDTPLHDAAINGHLKLVKLLVERGADTHAKNSKGKTPVDVAPAEVKPYLLHTNLPLPGRPIKIGKSCWILVADCGRRASALKTQADRCVGHRRYTKSPQYPPDYNLAQGMTKKITESNKQKGSADETMDAKNSAAAEDVYEFKSVKDGDSSPDQKNSDTQEMDADATDPLSISTPQTEDASKRGCSELTDPLEDTTGNDEESRRKKRKDETAKEGKSTTQRNAASSSGKSSGDKKSPCSSPKPAVSDAEVEDGKTDLKVPPLKIVIPQTTSSEQESGNGRNGKNSSQRTHQALPYVVASSNSNEPNEKETTAGTASPETSATIKGDDKKDSSGTGPSEERGGSSQQRVLRSSHRSGTTQGTDRGSNNSSPQLQRSHSPSPSSSPAAQPPNQADPPTSSTAQTSTISKSSDSQAPQNNDAEPSTSTSSSVATTSTPAPVELHPRKRKMKQNKEQAPPPQEPSEVPAEAQVHPHEQPITNCYQLFLDIRKQINKRRRGLFPVQPKPPQGFKDYLMNRCTYVLAGTAPTTPNITYPQNLPSAMKDLFTEQEKERYRLRTQHVIEKEKLVLSVEQEILRVHGRAARALANQSLPFSVCTILRDEEMSMISGKKIKEHMLLRHHNEAESMHAVQKMDWEWKMKELSLCDRKTTPKIEDAHVPMVHVSDDFDLLPA